MAEKRGHVPLADEAGGGLKPEEEARQPADVDVPLADEAGVD